MLIRWKKVTMKKIFYLGSYCDGEFKDEKRICSLAGMNKMKGIIAALSKDYKVEIISSSLTHGKKYCPKHEVILGDSLKLFLFSSLGRKGIITKVLDILWFKLHLIFFFLRNIHKNDRVIVYHSLIYVETVLFLHRIINFDLILEFEELYADVWRSGLSRNIELKLLKKADKFIFPTQLIPNKYNIPSDKYVIIHGNYCCGLEKKRQYDPGRNIEVVYAGTLDPRKGCIDAIYSAQYLPGNYHISILGLGSKEEIDRVEEAIEEVNKKDGARASFKGTLYGSDYEAFLQQCDIGLCTQDPQAKFTNTSFPSKIISYLSGGLRVLSIDIPAVRNSEIASNLYFYGEQTTFEIANGIKQIDMQKEYDSSKILHDLFEKSRLELITLIEKERV